MSRGGACRGGTAFLLLSAPLTRRPAQIIPHRLGLTSLPCHSYTRALHRPPLPARPSSPTFPIDYLLRPLPANVDLGL